MPYFATKSRLFLSLLVVLETSWAHLLYMLLHCSMGHVNVSVWFVGWVYCSELALECRTSFLCSSSACLISSETVFLESVQQNMTPAYRLFSFILSCFLDSNCLSISKTAPWMLLVAYVVDWAPFLYTAKNSFQPLWYWRYPCCCHCWCGCCSLYGAYLNEVHLTLYIRPFFLSSTCSGISEMLRLSVELLSVTNALFAEKAKYQ